MSSTAQTSTPTRPAFRYYGGKWNIASWIISFFPPHLNYVEPCGGGASVLLQKIRSPLETYNDLDDNVVNFFRVLRAQPNELIQQLELTPYARKEYEVSFQPADDSVEQARRFFVASAMSIIPILNIDFRPNLRSVRLVNRADHAPALPFLSSRSFDHLLAVANRLLGVQIENDTYSKIITAYDNQDTLIYFDPPYVENTRTEGGIYSHEWHNDDHIDAAHLLRDCSGYVVISGYACPLYTELYEAHGWQRHDKEAQTNGGGKRIESVWLSPRTVKALTRPKQVGLFT